MPTSHKGLKISFCTTCRGPDYLDRLKQTLPENLRRNTGTGHYDKVEFVVVAYGDQAVTDWLKATFPNEIKAGVVRAVDLPREQAEYFRMAHAKNVAHRCATGDVLCNLDCDNITGENFSGFLNEQFSRNANIVVCATTRAKLIRKLTTGENPLDTTGRIAISRPNYEMLHGYNEALNAAKDGDDTNLKERAYALGLTPVPLPASQFGRIISHSDNARMAHMSPAERAKSQANFTREGNYWERIYTAKRVILGEQHVIPADIAGANPDGAYGCAQVTVLNGQLEPEPLRLQPAPHAAWQPLQAAAVKRGNSVV